MIIQQYTHNWNQEFVRNSEGIKECELCLEIGAFEGLTSNYIVDNLLSKSGKLICIDPLTDQYLNTDLSEKDVNDNNLNYSYFNGQYNRFISNVEVHLKSGQIELIRDISTNVFADLINKYKGKFDFIYVDGDHRPGTVYIDAVNSFELCKRGGCILFDDYSWNDTHIGIDRFLNQYVGRYDVVLKNYQILIKKIG